MREYSMPALAQIPATANLADVVFRRAAEQPQAVVLRRPSGAPGFPGAWTDVTASQFKDEVVRGGQGAGRGGHRARDRVALMSHTRYEWTLIDYAIWTAGAVTVPVYETSSAEQAEWILSDSGARACFAETAAYGDIIGELPGPGARGCRTCGRSTRTSTRCARRARDVGDEVIAERAAAAGAADLATVIYTSGTTGRPKGCELTHENLLADVRQRLPRPADRRGRDRTPARCCSCRWRTCSPGSSRWAASRAGSCSGTAADLTALLPDAGRRSGRRSSWPCRGCSRRCTTPPSRRRSARRRARSSAAPRTPRSRTAGRWMRPAAVLRSACEPSTRCSTGWSTASCGPRSAAGRSTPSPAGRALSERLGHFFRGIGVTVLEGYGLTETTAAATVNRPDRNKIGTVGQPLPGVAIKIADDGEILISGKNVFPGYWRNEAATKEVFAEDGWFATGDIGELDEEGFLKITGRKKEMIVTAGRQERGARGARGPASQPRR